MVSKFESRPSLPSKFFCSTKKFFPVEEIWIIETNAVMAWQQNAVLLCCLAIYAWILSVICLGHMLHMQVHNIVMGI